MNPWCNVLSPAKGDKALHPLAALGEGGAERHGEIEREGDSATQRTGDQPGARSNQR